MQKVKKIIKGLLSYNENIAPVLNKSRVFNAYMAVYEIGCCVFFVMISGRTNQSGLVFRFIFQSVICNLSGLYIHVNHKIKFFMTAIQGMLVGQIILILLFINMLTCAYSVYTACDLVDIYYDK